MEKDDPRLEGEDDMKICPNCNKSLADDVKFCTGCGYKLDETGSNTHKSSDTHLNDGKNSSKQVFIIGICVFLVIAACFYFKVRSKQDTGQEITEQEQEQEQEQKTADNTTEEDSLDNLNSANETDGNQWFTTVFGGTFYVPEGFKSVDIGVAPGYVYQYKNDTLGMTIEVSEISFGKVGNGLEPQEQMMKDYQNQLDSLGDNVTYHLAKDNYCVLSGYGYYGNMDDIFYIKNININDTAYVTVMFDYPVENRKECDAILTEFLDDLSYDAF